MMDIKATHSLCEELQARNANLSSTLYITRWDLAFDWHAPFGTGCYKLDIRGNYRREQPSREFGCTVTGSDLFEVSTRAVKVLDALGESA